MALASMMFAACSSDVTGGGAEEEAGVESGEFTLTINTESDKSTRAARPLYSSEAFSNVDCVFIELYTKADGNWVKATTGQIAVKDGSNLTYDPSTSILTWTKNASNTTTTQATNKETLRLKNLVGDRDYRIAAYAYKSALTTTIGAANASTLVRLATPADVSNIEEIFSGVSSEFHTNHDGKVTTSQSIILNRQVAGVLGYFKNIPVKAGTQTDNTVKSIKIYTSMQGTSYNLLEDE